MDECCFEIDDGSPDQPLFHICNVCHRDDWTITANGLTSIYNACDCNPGQSFQFQGSAQIVATGPLAFITSVILWGHNITSGSITVDPPIFGGTQNIGLFNNGPCLDDETRPVIVSLVDLPDEGVGTVTIDITSDTDDIICIQEIFIGEKWFVPDDLLPSSYINIHNGCDYEVEVKNSDCGRLSQSLKHVPVDFEFEFDCVDKRWLKEEWRPLLKYMMRYGVLFQPSRNNCPQDLFNGWIEGPVGGSEYNNCFHRVVLNAKGYTSQDQIVKKFVEP